MNQPLQVSLTGADVSDVSERRFVHLTQPVENGMDKTASMYDIAQMVAMARAGRSARGYKKKQCPANIEDEKIKVRLDFEAWPSSPNLAYTLESNIGEISPASIVEEYTEFSQTFGKTDVVELDFILSELTSYYWETPCCTPKGVPVPDPIIEMDGFTTIRTEQPIFGVVRIKGKKIGARHVVTHELIKSYPVRPDNPIPDEGIAAEDLEEYWAYTDVNTWNGDPVNEDDTVDMTGLSIENLSITITARWISTEGLEVSNTMPLTIPQCIKDLLEPCGPDGNGDYTTFDLCPEDDDSPLSVYWSSCTGKVLAEIEREDDENSWCK